MIPILEIAEEETTELHIGCATIKEEVIGFMTYIFVDVEEWKAKLKSLDIKIEKSWWN